MEDVVCLTLDRANFNAILGPLDALKKVFSFMHFAIKDPYLGSSSQRRDVYLIYMRLLAFKSCHSAISVHGLM